MSSPDRRLYAFFIATYLAEGLIGVAYEPIYFLQKDVLRLTPSQSAAFTLVMTLPFLVKPLLGLLTDAVPLLRRRRLPYIVLAAGAASAGWAALALLGEYRYAPTLFLLTAVNVGIAFADTLCDGVMVECGKPEDKTGRFQAVQIGTLYASLLAAGLGGGWLAEHASYKAVFGLTALFPLLILLSALGLREAPAPAPAEQARKTWASLSGLVGSRAFWACCALIFLFSFNPFLGTPMFYFQSGPLAFTKLTIGALTSVSGLFGVLGAAVFGRFHNTGGSFFGRSARFDTPTLVRASLLAGAAVALAHLFYRGVVSAYLLTALYGTLGVFMRLALMDLVARMSPEHGEATAFALFMAVFNLAALASNTFGGWVYERAAAGAGASSAMNLLVVIGALCTGAAWAFLRWIPEAGLRPALRAGEAV